MDPENETEDLSNQYFQDKMFRICAKAIIKEDVYINRLYEPEYLSGLAERAIDEKEKSELLQQKKNAIANMNKVKSMFYECFNRYFFVYGVLQQVGHDDDD